MLTNVYFVIPAYNAENTIERSVLSALSQKNISPYVVIVDHGSSDKTKEISEKLEKQFSSVSCIPLKRTPTDLKSPSVPLNHAYNYLNSQEKINQNNMFMRLDADDFLPSTDAIYNALSSDKTYKLISCRLTFFGTTTCTAYSYGPKKKYCTKHGMLTKGAYAAAHHATLIRGDLLQKIEGFPNIYNEALSYGEDLDLTLKIFNVIQEGEYVFKEDSILLKSLHENSITSLTPRWEIMQSMRKIFDSHRTLSRMLLVFLFFDLLLRRKNLIASFLRPIFGLPAYKVGDIYPLAWEKLDLEERP